VAKIERKALPSFKKKALRWATQESDVVCFLDSNLYPNDNYGKYACLLAVGAKRVIKCTQTKNAFEQLKQQAKNTWLFGYLSYDLKNDVEQLYSINEDHLRFPALYFFEPQHLILVDKQGTLRVESDKKETTTILKEIAATTLSDERPIINQKVQTRISQSSYIQTIQRIQEHIRRGDVYEMNFCQEFFVEQATTPLPLFEQLNDKTTMPHAAYLSFEDKALMCASPERFLCKRGHKVISQPIKGTAKRGRYAEEDDSFRKKLLASEKDRTENVMIVDLVRNDLTKTCQTGTIKVEKLFDIRAFEQVFQMISTISGKIKEEIHWVDVIREAFPMGSMTGAPKVIAMQLIEKYERSKRGLYSGTVGYVTPDGDFDFNVVIRSLLYNASKQYLSFQVGGAIVYDSQAEEEYKECLLKAKAILEILGQPKDTFSLKKASL